MTTTPPHLRDNTEMNPDVLCPVQIHVHDPTIRERRRHPEDNRSEKRRRIAAEDRSKKWIDLDENVLDGYILIDDRNLGPSVPEIEGEELSYPDAIEFNDDDDDNNDDDCDKDTSSHGKREWSIYERLKRRDSRRHRPDFDFGATYPLANSHGNAYQDSSSHSKYTELYSGYQSTRNNLDTTRDLDVTSMYAVANSHGNNSDLAANMQNRDCTENMESDLAWDIRTADVNYEIANSHSNYRVFYDSQTQHQASLMPPWSSEMWSENHRGEFQVMSKDPKNDTARKQNNEGCETNNASQSEKNEQDSETDCDIEQCLVQIEESLLNIEQNLLHVQDLDIPELRNLLYKSPSIERSLYEVQDLLHADGIVPAITKKKSMSLDSDEEEEEEEDEEEEVEEEEVWVGQNITIKDNDDEDGNASAPLLNSSNEESSDTINVDEHNPSRSSDDHRVDWNDGSNVLREEAKDFQIGPEKTMNFVPNSLGKTLPRKIVLDEVKENIRLCSSEPEEPTITIDYNLNSACVEKKSLFRDKWHSRTNSLDENSIFQNMELGDKQENKKFSLQDIFLEATESRLTINAKARSEGTLQTDREKRRDRRGSHEKKLLQAVEATAEDFRKKLESFASQRRSILDGQKRTTPKSTKEVSDNTISRSREKRTTTTAAKMQDEDNSIGKNTGDKRKRKKTSGKNQSASENALVPSKLISLSLSLLLAALLQAVRCLTDLVEDAFRSVSYDKGLLQ